MHLIIKGPRRFRHLSRLISFPKSQYPFNITIAVNDGSLWGCERCMVELFGHACPFVLVNDLFLLGCCSHLYRCWRECYLPGLAFFLERYFFLIKKS